MATRGSSSLRFSDHIDIIELEPGSTHYRRERPRPFASTMAKLITDVKGEDVTDAMLSDAAKLFSEHYGIWGRNGAGKPGSRVRMNPSRLRAQCLPEGARNTYVMVTMDGVLAGHVFACRWEHQGRQVCWVTQLVVHSSYRKRRLATTLLLNLIQEDDDVFGIMSSHPVACKAFAKVIGDVRFSDISLDFIRDHASGILESSPVDYVRCAKFRGSLFDPQDTSGLVCGVDSNFFVDHQEPLEALAWFQQDENWPLGELVDGHEFLYLAQRQRRSRSRSARHCGTGNQASKK